MFDDRVTRFDAWEVEADFDHVCTDLANYDSIKVESEGPLEASIRIERSFGKSRLVQTIALGADSRRLDFRTWVDWREREKMLKAAFPTTVNPGAPARATYEIQYGHTERPTHHNTTWDQARFETCGHKWVDIGESNYGVALLNDCKYGHDVKDGQLRLTLLKAPTYPDPVADEGEHEFTYSLFPHIGNFRAAGVIQEAYSLNSPLVARETTASKGSLPPEHAFFTIDAPNVIIEAIKKAEKGRGLIVRVYEAHNARTRATLTLPRATKNATECNLVERDLEEIKVKGNRIGFSINPFEIKSFKIRF